jgi:hypothetical protein
MCYTPRVSICFAQVYRGREADLTELQTPVQPAPHSSHHASSSTSSSLAALSSGSVSSPPVRARFGIVSCIAPGAKNVHAFARSTSSSHLLFSFLLICLFTRALEILLCIACSAAVRPLHSLQTLTGTRLCFFVLLVLLRPLFISVCVTCPIFSCHCSRLSSSLIQPLVFIFTCYWCSHLLVLILRVAQSNFVGQTIIERSAGFADCEWGSNDPE